MQLLAAVVVALAAAWPAEALSVTVTDTECIHEFVPYEGDTVSGNFVVVDHDIFWSSDHPGIDLTVLARSSTFSYYASDSDGRIRVLSVVVVGIWGVKLGIGWNRDPLLGYVVSGKDLWRCSPILISMGNVW